MFKIDTGVPIPNEKLKRTSERTEFLKTLNVGDSFECSRREHRILSSYASRINIKLTSQRIEYGADSVRLNNYENDILRVWRTK